MSLAQSVTGVLEKKQISHEVVLLTYQLYQGSERGRITESRRKKSKAETPGGLISPRCQQCPEAPIF
jgi:hypothetical protein